MAEVSQFGEKIRHEHFVTATAITECLCRNSSFVSVYIGKRNSLDGDISRVY